MKRVLARALRVIFALLAGLTLFAAAAVVFFMTDPGEALLERLLIARINEQIEGRVTAGNLSFGGDSLELAAVHLVDPQGREVSSAGRLGADLALTSLLQGQLVFERVSASDVRVALWRTQAGEWGLARALASREPSAGPRRWPDVGIEQIQLDGVQVELELPTTGPALGAGGERLRARELAAHGWLIIRDERLEGELRGRGRLVEPNAATIAASLHARHHGQAQQLELQASVGAASTRLELRLPDDVALAGAGTDALERITAAVFVDAPAFELGGLEYGPLRLDAQLRGGRFIVPVLELHAPGLRVTRRDSSEETAVAARVDVESLAALGEALRSLSGLELPPLSGHGELRLALAGPLAAAEARLSGTLRGLEVGSSRASSLAISFAASPFGADAPAPAHVRLDAEALELVDHVVGPVTLDARLSASRRLTLSADVGSARKLRVRAGGQRLRDEPALRLEALTIAHSGATWQLESPPAWLRWGDGIGAEVAMRSGQQRIELDLKKASSHTRLQAELANVRLTSLLAPLPKSLLGRRRIGGTLDAHIVAERSVDAASWKGDAHVALSGGRWGAVRGVSLELGGRADAGRAQGSFRGEVMSGRARGRFDLPAEWPPPEGAALHADARIAGLRLRPLWRAMGSRALPPQASAHIQSVAGALAARAQVDGRWPSPRLTARLEVHAGSLQLVSGERYRDIELTADATPNWVSIHPLVVHSGGGRLDLSGHAARYGRGARVELEARCRGGFPIPMAPWVVSTATVTASGTLSARRLDLTLSSSDVRLVEPEPPAVSRLVRSHADASSR